MAAINGEVSHAILERGLEALVNLGHRGAKGSDPGTGDGAGVLTQIPDALLRAVAPQPLPPLYGVGMAFLPPAASERAECERIILEACASEGFAFLGWRDVPVDPQAIGRTARASMPVIRQFFVANAAFTEEGDRAGLERRLYVLRRVIEGRGGELPCGRSHVFYLPSLSCRTIVYKGMLAGEQIAAFYPDLRDSRFTTALVMVHERFSTNVLPRWDLAQPFRMACHNGEINTLQGNVNWMRARTAKFESPLLGEDVAKLGRVIDETGSDSAQFDNALELLVRAGRSVEHAMMMMIPEAWQGADAMDPDVRAFYEFHASILEPWDGPAAFAFSDGRVVAATLDRNGLRPARYIVTDDGLVVMASEAGVLDIAPERIVRSWRLEPGKMLLVDTERGEIVDDAQCKRRLAELLPYQRWIDEATVFLDEAPLTVSVHEPAPDTVVARQRLFGYTEEEVRVLLAPMASNGEEPAGSMGNDVPAAVLSEQPVRLHHYFKQRFAQVTNPPIDPIRERRVMSLVTSLGAGGNLLEEGPSQAQRLEIAHPILTNEEMLKLRHSTNESFPIATVSATFAREGGAEGLRAALRELREAVSEQVAGGATIVVLSDRDAGESRVPIPSLLACAAVHHHLVREGTRTSVGLVIESGEIREVMQVALLVGYGAEAVNPYLALDSVIEMERRGLLPADLDRETARHNIVHAFSKGLLKTMSKMGISTVLSYCGAQIFEAVGLSEDVVAEYFTGTPSRIGGIGLAEIAAEAIAFHDTGASHPDLGIGGEYQWRRGAQAHAWNPETIATLQQAVRTGDSAAFDDFVALADDESRQHRTLRGLFAIDESRAPIPIDEVEPAEEIVRRFATGAMSFGSISKEAHENLAIAMNRAGGKSNTGEGGEDAERFVPDANGDWRRSAIKQVASARFGVTAHYLVNADELQIKVAQGAKPGEGGQLPGNKVDETIARLRHSTPGVGLISPPPHHDIYSIEDLAQLIRDLKCVNPGARISVKLVAEAGVGTIAAGVAKAHADHIVISGYDGGTGAAPLSSIKHAGVPWELGLAEAQQVLVANGLRDRVVLQADGQLKTGRDVLVAALLGAEEFGFSTAALVASGCVMMRVCHLNTCPVGIATQDERLRRRFGGTPQHVVNFIFFVAEDLRRWMARLGFHSLDEVVGRSDLLRARTSPAHEKAARLDLSRLLDPSAATVARETPSRARHTTPQENELDAGLDIRFIREAGEALAGGDPVRIETAVANRDRSVGAMLSGEVARRHGAAGLPDDTITVALEGSAGQSFGAWLAPGITLALHGETNDYAGKGLSGGRLVVRARQGMQCRPEESIVTGNVALYGATSGEAFFNGVAGERFAVRNSGATAVVEGVGDHGCEYMTGGVVVVLGETGRNFAAGMSGGVAYVLDRNGAFAGRCNRGSIEFEALDDDDRELLHELVQRHAALTGSGRARDVLRTWDSGAQFVKVMPVEYRRALLEAESRELEKAG